VLGVGGGLRLLGFANGAWWGNRAGTGTEVFDVG
jgi:hypothetical protein